MKRLTPYLQLMRLDKPIGTLLLLWPTLWGLWVAGKGHPNWTLVTIFVVGVFTMRSAGDIINDIADYKFDGQVKRTSTRPLVTQALSRKAAFLSFILLLSFAFLLVLMMNPFTIALAFIGAGLTIFYPFTKRFFAMPQFILGLAYSWGILLAFAAQTNSLPPIAWLLYSIAVIWPIAYDTMYAMVDRDDDLLIGIKSSAILFGNYDRMFIGICQCTMIILFLILGEILHLNAWYYLFILLSCGFLIYQHVLIKDYDREKCFQAFLNNNWYGFVMFLAIYFGFN